MKYRITTIGLALTAALGQAQAQESIKPKEADYKLIP
ncbi:MAG: hypothetical protein CM1200mP29_07970 [Verrucomicrobiota bacterium]|nr:MAG: hypothetical protein CM1200mP29_07970 [Verrucomicrobiota bacterium]